MWNKSAKIVSTFSSIMLNLEKGIVKSIMGTAYIPGLKREKPIRHLVNITKNVITMRSKKRRIQRGSSADGRASSLYLLYKKGVELG